MNPGVAKTICVPYKIASFCPAVSGKTAKSNYYPRADSLFSQALMDRVPKGTEEINRKALHDGIEAAKRIDLRDLPLLAIE